MNGEIENAMFIGKGSLFLGKMTTLSDGMSFLIEKNEGVE
jgi:betaine reductase